MIVTSETIDGSSWIDALQTPERTGDSSAALVIRSYRRIGAGPDPDPKRPDLIRHQLIEHFAREIVIEKMVMIPVRKCPRKMSALNSK
jgi:hypothetical protein